MKQKSVRLFVAILMCFILVIPAVNTHAATTVTTDQTGTDGGYYYSFWNQGGGSVVMTLNGGGNYSVTWSNCTNFTCGKGWSTGAARNVSFQGNFDGGNNGYLALYGWTKNPLIEYYVIENYGSWVPPGATSLGTMTSDGGTYNIYCTQRVNQPSIVGTATFDQYWSVRTTKRSTGTITFSNHINEWASKGMNLGTTWDYQIMVSEGYQSSGSANITVSEAGGINPTPIPTSAPTGTPVPTTTPIVTPTPIPTGTYPTWNSTTIYNNGDIVSYGGKLWVAGWYTQGQIPGTTGEWGVWKEYSGGTPTTTTPTPTSTPSPGTTTGRYECESMTLGGTYAGTISSPFSGVALYANNDYCQTDNITWDNTQRTVSVRGSSSNSSTATVVVKMNGYEIGKVNFTGTTPTTQSITCTPQTGSYPVQLMVTNDTGSWDAYVDYIEISGGGTTNLAPTPTPTPSIGTNGNVYLSFDDGPNNNSSTMINNLKSAGCNQATLFVWGNRISSNASAWNSYLNSGFSLQNHSWTHSHMTSWSYQQVYNDLQQCSQAIQNAGKAKPTKIRLPYLESNSTIQTACTALGLSIVQPSVDTQDWNGASTQSIINACNNLQAGGNPLMHDGYQTTNSAIATIVQNLKNRGFGFAQY